MEFKKGDKTIVRFYCGGKCCRSRGHMICKVAISKKSK